MKDIVSTHDFERYHPSVPLLSSQQLGWEGVTVRAYNEQPTNLFAGSVCLSSGRRGISPLIRSSVIKFLCHASPVLPRLLPKREGRPSRSASKPDVSLSRHPAPQRYGSCHEYLSQDVVHAFDHDSADEAHICY